MHVQDMPQLLGDYLIEQRRRFHRIPEPSGEEIKTSAAIAAELEAAGIACRRMGKTGLVADIAGCGPGKTFLLRADIDGLSVNEQTNLPFASEHEGMMHACGHDCHISMLLTAARALQEMRDQFKGTVRILFQPAEEIGAGALEMIRLGVLEGVSGAFGIHVWSDIDAGKCSIAAGARMASADRFEIEIHAKSGHASQPHLCVDAIPAASAVISAIQTIVSRETPPTETAVVTVGKLTAGTRWNVTAGSAKLEGTTRCFSDEVRNKFEGQLKRIAEQTAAAYGAAAEVRYQYMLGSVINSPELLPVVSSAADQVMPGDWHVDYPLTMGAEDFSEYQRIVPGMIILLGVRNPETDSCWPQHSCYYKVDESVLIRGAMMHVQVALNWLAANA